MNIEILYPEICCLYGDKGNTLFLKQCFPNANIIETSLNKTPYFVNNNVNLVYFGSMSASNQALAIDLLSPYKEVIKDLIENEKTFFLCTGQAMEIFGDYIEDNTGKITKGLHLFDYYTKQKSFQRNNSLLKIKFNDMTVIGYTSRFTHTYNIDENYAFGTLEIGMSSCGTENKEGIYYKNFIGTYTLGPILVSNPDFSLWLFNKVGLNIQNLPYEDKLRHAYNHKLKEFKKEGLELE